jgi:DNA-binding LacI/PurR family transcriptional regulator/DNA-binding transcriptional regulator YhcF (GntR family)
MPVSSLEILKRQPEYKRIEGDLRLKIASARWSVGTVLPSRRDLAAEYGVQVQTVQRAIQSLLEDGTLRANPRTGTVVARGAEGKPTGNPSSHSAAHTAPASHNARRRRDHATIGMIAAVPVDHSLWAENWQKIIISAFERTLSRVGSVTVSFHNRTTLAPSETGNPDLAAMELLVEEGASAVVSIFCTDRGRVADVAKEAGVPVVFVMGDSDGELDFPVVRYDHVHAGYQATEHLLSNGYRRFSYFMPYREFWAEERLVGVRRALTKAGLADRDLRVSMPLLERAPSTEFQKGYAKEAAVEFLKGLGDGEGIVAVNDNAAHGLIAAASDAGLQAGRDYGIVSFDDGPLALRTGLSAIRPPLEQMGIEAAKIVEEYLTGQSVSLEVVLKSHVASRRSSAPLRGTHEREG